MSAPKLSREKLRNCRSAALKVAAVYAVFGMVWILFSDRLLESIIQDMALMGMIQTVKGGFYVLITGVLVGMAVYRYAIELLEIEEEREQRESRLQSRLHSARTLLKTVMDVAPDLIFVKDRSGSSGFVSGGSGQTSSG